MSTAFEPAKLYNNFNYNDKLNTYLVFDFYQFKYLFI